MSLESAIVIAAINGEHLSPKITESIKYKHWLTVEDWKRCLECAGHHGKIYLIEEAVEPEPPLHPNCRCYIENMKSIKAGTATTNGVDGADWSLKYDGRLPEYYVTRQELKPLGWKYGDKVSKFVYGKTFSNGIYRNDDAHLPQKAGRIWYEADINYKTGKRNKQRILWSNDGLIFVTYDHYETFYEIV